ncbi:hypothetical protein YUBABA_02430 [Serratia phage vB_SmaM-Yubaba]|nr:hypothetical protein YUBABA_02430 [Serratia phage vB_SmaM-Yubaba]
MAGKNASLSYSNIKVGGLGLPFNVPKGGGIYKYYEVNILEKTIFCAITLTGKGLVL